MLEMPNPTGKHRPKRRHHGEGTIFERRDHPRLARFAGLLSLGNDGTRRRRKWFYGASRDEVRDRMLAYRRGTDPTTMTVADHMTAWLDGHRDAIGPATWQGYEADIRLRIEPTLGGRRLVDLTTADIRSAMRSWRARRAMTLNVLRTGLGAAVREGLIPANVASSVAAPRHVKRQAPTIGPAEAHQILEAVAGDWTEPIVRTILALGGRRGEALGLRWADVDLEAGTIRIRSSLRRIPREYRVAGESPYRLVEPKGTRGPRTVTVPRALVATLEAHRETQLEQRRAAKVWAENGLVFATPKGNPIPPGSVTRRFEQLARSVGLPDLRLHDLRHSSATILLAAGVPMKVVSERLGHSTLAMTADVYSHVTPALDRLAADQLEEVLG